MIASVDAAQIEQRIQVFRGAARDDGQDMHVRPVVDDAGHLRGKTERRALDQAAGEADRPGVHSLFLRLIRCSASRRAARSAPVRRLRQAEVPA